MNFKIKHENIVKREEHQTSLFQFGNYNKTQFSDFIIRHIAYNDAVIIDSKNCIADIRSRI